MNKRTVILFILLILLCGCAKKTSSGGCDHFEDCTDIVETSGTDFKSRHEELNGLANKSGKVHRSIVIPDDHPFVQVEAEEVLEKIKNKETFYVYVGDEACPWCRSNIEMAIKVAKDAGIDRIYYIEIWDDEGNEILRDQYKLEDGKIVKTMEGTDTYKEFLKYWESFLEDYTLKDDDGNEIEVGEKRIYAPNYFYIENGELERFTDGSSELQEGSRDELTEEILKDQEMLFRSLFGAK